VLAQLLAIGIIAALIVVVAVVVWVIIIIPTAQSTSTTPAKGRRERLVTFHLLPKTFHPLTASSAES
jgi:hypothetical protein